MLIKLEISRLSMIPQEKALNLIHDEYARLDELIGVDSSQIEIKISTRLKRHYGYFMYKPKLRIVIANAALRSYKIFYEVIRHEYAHAALWLLEPGVDHKHDLRWRDMARQVGCIPRATIKLEKIDDFHPQNEQLSILNILQK